MSRDSRGEDEDPVGEGGVGEADTRDVFNPWNLEIVLETPGQAFTAQRDGEKFHSELTRVLTRPTAFEAVMRVRTTRGLRITNFYGNYFIRGTDLLALPNCTPDSVFAVEFGYDEQILGASVICIQVGARVDYP